MKNTVIKSVLAIVMAFMALPMMGRIGWRLTLMMENIENSI